MYRLIGRPWLLSTTRPVPTQRGAPFGAAVAFCITTFPPPSLQAIVSIQQQLRQRRSDFFARGSRRRRHGVGIRRNQRR